MRKPRNKSRRLKAWEKPLPPLQEEQLELPTNASLAFRFAVYGDNQRGIAIHRQIVSAIGISRAEVVLHVGDYVQNGRDDEQWDEQFAFVAQPLLEKTTFLGVQGNHDHDSGRYYEIIDPPGGRSWFKVVYGPVAFFGLDTNRQIGERSQQLAWLDKELSHTDACWKVAFFHEAPYSSSWPWPGGAVKTRKALIPILEKHEVDVVFCGHIHNYERFHCEGIPYFITGGGGDTLSKPEQLHNPHRVWTMMTHNFCTVDVYPRRLEVLARDISGVPFDGLTIKKGQLAEIQLENRRKYNGPRPESRQRRLSGSRVRKKQA